MAFLPDYAELHCLSNFSFLRGASHPHELVERAAALGYSAFALTDECSVAGMVRAHVAAKDLGLKLIVGTEISVPEKLVLLAPDRVELGGEIPRDLGKERERPEPVEQVRQRVESFRTRLRAAGFVCGGVAFGHP